MGVVFAAQVMIRHGQHEFGLDADGLDQALGLHKVIGRLRESATAILDHPEDEIHEPGLRVLVLRCFGLGPEGGRGQ